MYKYVLSRIISRYETESFYEIKPLDGSSHNTCVPIVRYKKIQNLDS